MLKIGGRRGSIGSYAAFQELPESSFAQDPDPKIGRVFSSMDDHTMSVIDTLRYLPYNVWPTMSCPPPVSNDALL